MIDNSSETRVQFIRYAIVGLGSNILLYLAYLILTTWGMGHKTSMTLLYGVGVLQTFIFNKRWSFGHQGQTAPALRRYIITYGMGYAINIFALWVFVDKLGFAHQWIQAVMVFVVAGVIFLMQRYWVFPHNQIEAEMAK